MQNFKVFISLPPPPSPILSSVFAKFFKNFKIFFVYTIRISKNTRKINLRVLYILT